MRNWEQVGLLNVATLVWHSTAISVETDRNLQLVNVSRFSLVNRKRCDYQTSIKQRRYHADDSVSNVYALQIDTHTHTTQMHTLVYLLMSDCANL